MLLGGLSGGSSSDQILAGPPQHLRRVGTLPVPTHDDAAILLGKTVYLLGGGQATSSDAVVRITAAGRARRAGTLGEPLSDLGAAVVGNAAYIAGGYTGAQYATGILRLRGGAPKLAARLPTGLRYAGVTSLGGKVYVAGGITTAGASSAVYRFDPSTGNVEQLATLPRPVAHAPLVALGGSLYLLGGDGSDAVWRIGPDGTVAPRRPPSPRARERGGGHPRRLRVPLRRRRIGRSPQAHAECALSVSCRFALGRSRLMCRERFIVPSSTRPTVDGTQGGWRGGGVREIEQRSWLDGHDFEVVMRSRAQRKVDPTDSLQHRVRPGRPLRRRTRLGGRERPPSATGRAPRDQARLRLDADGAPLARRAGGRGRRRRTPRRHRQLARLRRAPPTDLVFAGPGHDIIDALFGVHDHVD